MTKIILEKLFFSKSDKYEELFYFTAYATNRLGIELKIAGLSTPELNQVNFLWQRQYDVDIASTYTVPTYIDPAFIVNIDNVDVDSVDIDDVEIYRVDAVST